MPRGARLDVPNVLQHVMARGIEGREIFRDRKDREEFLRRLSEVVIKGQGQLFAWSLISNHFHLLLSPRAMPLATMMRRLLTGYAVWHNRRHGRKKGQRPSNTFPVDFSRGGQYPIATC